MADKTKSRFWEIDAARGIAILMMVVYHTAYDLDTFGGYALDSTSGLWARFADLTASTFLFVVGVSLAVSYARDVAKGNAGFGMIFGKYLWRGAKVFGCGLILTAVFWIFGMGYVVFGILHVIGVSIVLAYPLLRFRWTNLVLGVLILAAGLYVMQLEISPEMSWYSLLALPFGIVPEGFGMPDYRPLLPWFGVVLIGVFAGNMVYGNGRRLTSGDAPLVVKPLLPLGRNSLIIYMVHQPVIIVLLAVFGIISLGLF